MSGISREAWIRSCVLMAEAPALAAAEVEELVLLPTAARLSGMSTLMVSMMDNRWATCQGEIQTCIGDSQVENL